MSRAFQRTVNVTPEHRVASATPERGSSVADATPFDANHIPGVETPG